MVQMGSNVEAQYSPGCHDCAHDRGSKTDMALYHCTAASNVGDRHIAWHDAPKVAILKGSLVSGSDTG